MSDKDKLKQPIIIEDTKAGEEFYDNQEDSVGWAWDRETRHALRRLYTSSYRLYAILLKPGLWDILQKFMQEQKKFYFDHTSSRPLFCYRQQGNLVVLDFYADQHNTAQKLEQLLDEQGAKYLVGTGHHKTLDDNLTWYKGLEHD